MVGEVCFLDNTTGKKNSKSKTEILLNQTFSKASSFIICYGKTLIRFSFDKKQAECK